MKIIFMGSRNAGYFGLKHLIDSNYNVSMVVTTEDSSNAWYRSVKDLAKENGLLYLIPKKMKDVVFIKSIVDLKPDVIFSMYFDKIIPEEILESAKYNINFHGGILPKYKGCVSSAWSIINNEKETAVTAHLMDKGIDTGDIIKERRIKIRPNETGRQLYEKVSHNAVELLKELLPIIERGELKTYSQDKGGNYYGRDIPNDGIINWEKENLEIYNFIRALNFPPFNPAKTYFNGKELYVWESEIKNYYESGKCGEILKTSEDGFIVGTKGGSLLVKKVKIDGTDLCANDFMRSYNVKLGDKLH